MNERRFHQQPVRPNTTQELRSQLALELLLHGYAIVGSLILFRTLLKMLEVGSNRWVGVAIYGVTNLIAFPLTLVPGAGTVLLGALTLSDATLLALVVLFPLGILIFGSIRGRN